MNESEKYLIPEPILDDKEKKALTDLTEKYDKMLQPTLIKKAGKAIGTTAKNILPEKVQKQGKELMNGISEKELYIEVVKKVGECFNILEKIGAKYTLSRGAVVKSVNKKQSNIKVTSLNEFCLLRSYDIDKSISKNNDINIISAFAEGGAFGLGSLAVLPLNIAISMFLYFRAVQNVALYYGYDVKEEPEEMEIAAGVFSNALSPSNNMESGIGNVISKIMITAEFDGLKNMANKTWTQWASEGGIALLICQLRALSNKAAQKALENAGKKGLEESVFTRVLTRIGAAISKESAAKVVPHVAGFIVGAAFDTTMMNKILKYANIFYQKRFILEKQMRINELLGINCDSTIDVDFTDVEEETQDTNMQTETE